MQYRYKLGGSNQARKSSTNTNQLQKNDTITYINLLDKCTQILREDRIWIRNQLKAGDEDIFKIFKQAKRPLNLQHLQIRLRKYVTSVKSKAKMEQLMKFKENMHLGDWTHSKEDVNKDQHNQSKRQTLPKYQLPSTLQPSNAETRGMKARMNNSIDKQSKSNMIYPYRNSSANPKKPLDCQFNGQMEQITQRQSQNMTSARQRPPIEQNSIEGFTFSHNYQQWKRPQQVIPNALNSNYINDPFKPKANQSNYFNNFMVNQKEKNQQINSKVSDLGSKPTLNHHSYDQYMGKNTSKENFKKSYQDQKQNNKKQSNCMTFQKQQQSYERANKKQYDQFYNNSQERSQSNANSNSYYEDYSPNIQKSTIQGASHSNFLDTLNVHHKFQEQKYKRNQLAFQHQTSTLKPFSMGTVPKNNTLQQTDLLHSKTSSIPFSSATNNDSLFTSPELLAECRNFLKLKSSAKPSVQKDYANNRTPIQIQKFQPLKFDQTDPIKSITPIDNSHSESSMLKMFNDINCGMVSSIAVHQNFYDNSSSKIVNYTQTIKVTKQITKQVTKEMPRQIPRQQPREISNYMPNQQNIQQSTYQKTNQLTNKNSGAYEYFHTFAALSSQKKPQQQNQREQRHQYEYQSSQGISPESFIDMVFTKISDEPDGYIYWYVLESLAKKIYPQLTDQFRQYLLPPDEQKLVLISNIGRLLQDLTQNQGNHESENDARNIYRLLDIEQKGYITEQDIQDFIRQLEDSEAQDIQTISQHMWKLFESIDQDAEETEGKRIDYWGIYSKKNSPDFQDLNQILKQFQFQIE